MIALAIALAVLVGVSLGLLGGGGSILAVPLLVYVAGMDAKEAIATSLLVVGTTSAVALIPHARAGRVRWRTGLLFGAAGMVGAYAGGRVAAFIPGSLLLVAFALMMLATAVAMIALMCGPPCSPGKPAVVIFAASFGSVVREHAPRGPHMVLWVVKLVMSAMPTGLGKRPAATRPAGWAMSASR